MPTRRLHHPDVAAHREGDTLEDGPVKMTRPVRCGEAEELGPRVGLVAEPLPGEVGEEEQAVRAGRRPGRLGHDGVVVEGVLVKGPPGPAHGVPPGVEQDEPAPVSVGRGRVADLGVQHGLLGDDGDDGGGSGDVGAASGVASSRAEQRHGVVGGAHQHRSSLEQASVARGARGQVAQDSRWAGGWAGRSAASSPRSSSMRGDQSYLDGSMRKLSEASVRLKARSPVSRKLM